MIAALNVCSLASISFLSSLEVSKEEKKKKAASHVTEVTPENLSQAPA